MKQYPPLPKSPDKKPWSQYSHLVRTVEGSYRGYPRRCVNVGERKGAIHAVRLVAEETLREAVLVNNAVSTALDSNQGYGLQNLNRQVKEAVAKAEDAKYRAKYAEDRVNSFKEANRLANEFRDEEEKVAEKAAEVAGEVVKASRAASIAARNAAKHAAGVLQHVTKVKAAAAQGKIEEGQREANKAAGMTNLVEKELQNAEVARDKARELVLNLVKQQIHGK